MSNIEIGLESLESCAKLLRDVIRETPIKKSERISASLSAEIFLKLENLQTTGSFKIRGAYNALHNLVTKKSVTRVVAASAGNHAQGVAWAAQAFNIDAKIVMPEGTPIVKVEETRRMGASILLHGANFEESLKEAERLAEVEERAFVSAFNDVDVMCGQGTLGLEIVRELIDLDTVIVPVGGGGLISGVASAVKALHPSIRVIGVETEALPSMTHAIRHGGPVSCLPNPTIAEGIAVSRVGDLCYDIARTRIDEMVCVSEDEVARGILYLLEREKTVAEGAGASAVAALLGGHINVRKGEKICALVCGGNIDVTLLSRIIHRGLGESGRLLTLRVTTDDKPGSLAGVLGVIGNVGANVREVFHERVFTGATMGAVEIELVLETRGREHGEACVQRLEEKGFHVTPGRTLSDFHRGHHEHN